MAREDVERFVGLLVSDETFVQSLTRNFDRTLIERKINLDKRERVVLKEGLESYVRPDMEAPSALGGPAPVATAAGAAVGAAVAGSVAGNVATKVVDKLTNNVLTNPVNVRIRDSILHRGLLKETDFSRVRDIRQPPLKPFQK